MRTARRRRNRSLRRFPRVTNCLLAIIALFVAAFSPPPARAARLLFERGGVLYSADEEGKDTRRLFALDGGNGGNGGPTAAGTGDGAPAVWAASPDGRRVAWLTRPPVRGGGDADAPLDLARRAAVVYVSDLTGRHRKRLFKTDTLRDRQNRRVTRLTLPVGAASPGGGDGAASQMKDWEPVSLAFSADSRTLYLSCAYLPEPGGRATFAVDAASGAALIDGAGRWRSLAPVADIEARGGLLVGSGFARYTLDGTPTVYNPLLSIVPMSGEVASLYTPERGAKELPPQATTAQPALSPGNRAIAFVAVGKGIYVTDKYGKAYRPVVEGGAVRPRWAPDGRRLYFLLPRPFVTGTATSVKPVLDLYVAPVPEEAGAVQDAPTLLQQNVTGFALVP